MNKHLYSALAKHFKDSSQLLLETLLEIVSNPYFRCTKAELIVTCLELLIKSGVKAKFEPETSLGTLYFSRYQPRYLLGCNPVSIFLEKVY